MPPKRPTASNKEDVLARRIEKLENQVNSLLNNKILTAPLYDSANLPAEGVEGQIAIGDSLEATVPSDKSLYLFTQGQWWQLRSVIAGPLGDIAFFAYLDSPSFQPQAWAIGSDGSTPPFTQINPTEDPVYAYQKPMWENINKNSIIVEVNSTWTSVGGYDNSTYYLYRLLNGFKQLIYSRSRTDPNDGSAFPFAINATGIKLNWSRLSDNIFVDPATETPPWTGANPTPVKTASLMDRNFQTDSDDLIIEMADITSIAGASGSYKYGSFDSFQWIPDGSKILFFADNPPYTFANSGIPRQTKMFVCDPDGTNPVLLAEGSYTGGSGSVDGDFYANRAEFASNDFTKVYYLGRVGTSYYVRRVNIDGTGKTDLYNEGGTITGSFRISPDGSKIAFIGQNGHIKIINIDGTGVQEYVPSPALPTSISNFAWSDDGLFLSASGQEYIAVLDIVGNSWTLIYNDDSPNITFISSQEWAYREDNGIGS